MSLSSPDPSREQAGSLKAALAQELLELFELRRNLPWTLSLGPPLREEIGAPTKESPKNVWHPAASFRFC